MGLIHANHPVKTKSKYSTSQNTKLKLIKLSHHSEYLQQSLPILRKTQNNETEKIKLSFKHKTNYLDEKQETGSTKKLLEEQRSLELTEDFRVNPRPQQTEARSSIGQKLTSASIEEWNVFLRRWNVFRAGSGIDATQAPYQLFQWAGPELGDSLLKANHAASGTL